MISDDHEHPRSPSAPRHWSQDTDLCCKSPSRKIRLKDQTPIIQATISTSFNFLHASLVLEHAFPDAMLSRKFILDALSTAALHVPNAEGVHVRIHTDHTYFVQLAALVCIVRYSLKAIDVKYIQPRAQISVLRAEVKERCVAAIALSISASNAPIVIMDLVDKLQTDFNYIFPRRLNSANASLLRRSKINLTHIPLQNNVLIGSPNISQPYRSTIIISIIRDLFFVGHSSFVLRHQALFLCHKGTNGEDIWEVPKAMVASVSTGVRFSVS